MKNQASLFLALLLAVGCSYPSNQYTVLTVDQTNGQRVETTFDLTGTVYDADNALEGVYVNVNYGLRTRVNGTFLLSAKTPTPWVFSISNLTEGSTLPVTCFAIDDIGRSTQTNTIVLNIGLMEIEPNNTPATATVIDYTGYRWGMIDSSGDNDYYSVNLVSNQFYTFYTTNRLTNNVDNSNVLVLYDTTGLTIIAAGGYGLPSSVISNFKATNSGNYYLLVTNNHTLTNTQYRVYFKGTN